jgi:hypothetical protein
MAGREHGGTRRRTENHDAGTLARQRIECLGDRGDQRRAERVNAAVVQRDGTDGILAADSHKRHAVRSLYSRLQGQNVPCLSLLSCLEYACRRQDQKPRTVLQIGHSFHHHLPQAYGAGVGRQ